MSPALNDLKAVSELGAEHDSARVTGQPCDITDPEQLDALWSAATEAFGSVDVWINNAGVSAPRAKLWEQPLADIHAVLDTNLLGTVLGVRTAISGILAQPNLRWAGCLSPLGSSRRL